MSNTSVTVAPPRSTSDSPEARREFTRAVIAAVEVGADHLAVEFARDVVGSLFAANAAAWRDFAVGRPERDGWVLQFTQTSVGSHIAFRRAMLRALGVDAGWVTPNDGDRLAVWLNHRFGFAAR